MHFSSNFQGPVVTDNGNFILDWKFSLDSNDVDWDMIDRKITCFPGKEIQYQY